MNFLVLGIVVVGPKCFNNNTVVLSTFSALRRMLATDAIERSSGEVARTYCKCWLCSAMPGKSARKHNQAEKATLATPCTERVRTAIIALRDGRRGDTKFSSILPCAPEVRAGAAPTRRAFHGCEAYQLGWEDKPASGSHTDVSCKPGKRVVGLYPSAGQPSGAGPRARAHHND
jgi:hypothetical protein